MSRPSAARQETPRRVRNGMEMPLPPHVYLGTSSWTAPSWSGVFYPPGLSAADYLAHYATRFRSVEVDSTWYRPPAPQTVDDWHRKTPDGFVFSLKVPRVITHERVLVDCEEDLESFVETVRRLGPKLGALLLQFPYFRRDVFPDLGSFLARLVPFLAELPEAVRFAVEIRNKAWLQPPLFAALRERRVALVWTDHPWMPTAAQYGHLSGAVTSDFLYVRWLGDRHGIEEITTTWDRPVVDREPDLRRWVEVLGPIADRAERLYGYANNHYSGCGFHSADQFAALWDAAGTGSRHA